MKKLINEQLENYNDAILQWWMYHHDGSDQDQKRDLSRGFILASAILPGPCAFNIRAGYIWAWL